MATNSISRARGNSIPPTPNPEPRHLATLLSLTSPVAWRGKRLFAIPIAVIGTWVKSGREFSITPQDLADMVRNFSKRKNEQVVIDYEHASEAPEIARGGPVPAAGWIHELRLEAEGWAAGNGRSQASGLKALVEWTPDAEAMIRRGQYRFFSPAIDWSVRDKESGDPQGATLTSGALTNHPFLEELPPIMLTDLDKEVTGYREQVTGEKQVIGYREQVTESRLQVTGNRLQEEPETSHLAPDTSAQRLQEMAGIHQDGYAPGVSTAPRGGQGQGPAPGGAGNTRYQAGAPEGGPQGGKAVRKKLTFKKLADKGKRAICDDAGDELGEISLDELDLDDAELDELLSRRGAPAARAAMLSETLRDGGINLDLAARLADEGRIAFGDYRAAQKAQQMVERAISDGKFTPADREFISRLALAEPERFEAWVRRKPRAVQLGGPAGVVAGGSEDAAQNISLRLDELMQAKNLTRQMALQELARTDPELIRRWRWGGK